MKKLMATLLTGCLVFQSCLGFAMPVQEASASTKTAVTANTKSVEKASSSRSEDSAQKSTLKVELHSSSRFPYQGKVQVEVSKISGEDGKGATVIKNEELDFSDVFPDGSKPGETTDVFKTVQLDVHEGTYKVTVLAERFAEYEQTITAEKGIIHKITIYPTKIETGKGKPVPGRLLLGDITKDYKITKEDDVKEILSNIRDKSNNAVSDLDGNGTVDIADLQLLVQNLEETPQESRIEKLTPVQDAALENSTVTVDGSKLTDLLENKSVAVAMKNGETINSNNAPEISFSLAKDGEEAPKIEGMVLQAPMADNEGATTSEISDLMATIELPDGTEITASYTAKPETSNAKSRKVKAARIEAINPEVAKEADGSLVLNLGTQTAVKKITIKITGTTQKDAKLVNIAKVEFVNNMADRIPAPDLSIPSTPTVVPGDASLSLSWTAQTNVTGYEIYISGPVGKKGSTRPAEQIISVSNAAHSISSINDSPLVNFETYTMKVRSVNGDWRSPWSDPATGTPEPQSVPAPPDDVKATGGYHSITVIWKNMKDSKLYMVYYKKAEEDDSKYQPAAAEFAPGESKKGDDGKIIVTEPTNAIAENRYTISGLEENVDYKVYVVGWNEKGWGGKSLTSIATTTSDNPPLLPKYKLLNTSNGEGKLTNHIVTATIGTTGNMQASPLDTTARSGLGLVDDSYISYWSRVGEWDDGASYAGLNKGMFITLDNDYEMNYLTFAATDEAAALGRVRIDYQDSSTTSWTNVGARLYAKTDANNNRFYIAKFDKTIKANNIHLSVGRSTANRSEMKIGEIHFHQYDSLEDDIMALYTNEMHSTLRADVTHETIQTLENRLETIDQASGEKHPLYKELKLELKTAKEILDANLAPAYAVDSHITAKKDTHLGFGGLNAWQPLGRVAYAGETLLVYVGHNTKRTGDATDLQLVMTQYHSESSGLMKTASLKVGRNEITVPQIVSVDGERGGQLYIAYTGNNTSDQYAVRVSGGSSIPALNIYKKTGAERTEAIKAYVEELEKYVGTIQATHNSLHQDGAKAVNYDYSVTNCILNATDIMMESMMYSLPATQVLAPLKDKADKVTWLDDSLKAMEDTMTLFYQHKGLSNEAGNTKGNNALPSQHLNIRYMRMFAGAFMYAAGNHIGIEYGSTQLASGASSWDSFGWGIAHEIGHDINQGTYAIAEVTNNYFSQLLTKKQRFTYENVYKKVTSGTVGRASNVFTQLALYWQLHLAYDDNTDDRHIFSDYNDQFNNLFFARVDTYSRNPSKAPKGDLTLDGGTDQNLMRLACAAAEKNILPFFERWGMIPNTATIEYAAKYGDPETKALYYVKPSAREYRVAHPNETGTIKNKDVVTASVTSSAISANQVTLEINTSADKDLILGYEISRSMTSNGKEESKVVGFQEINTSASSTTFTDTISTINNRVMTYTVKAVDKFLNYSNLTTAGAIKIKTDGVINKDAWTVETTMTSNDDTKVEPDEETPDSGYDESNPENVAAGKKHSIDRIIDNDKASADGTYHGISAGNAVITIDMHETKEVTALKYLGTALSSVTVEVSTNDVVWTTVKSDYKNLKESTSAKEETIWFDSVNDDEEIRSSWIGTYDARYVRLTIPQTGNISINEIEICGPSGDNLEFRKTDDNQTAIGILKEDYNYTSNEKDIIPAGSLVFAGSYKGNPAFNAVILYDTKGNIIGADMEAKTVNSEQIIFANVPDRGDLGETSDGTWVYYVEPEYWNENTLKNIDGVRGELYRVDVADTLEGERMVSDTLTITMPSTLSAITLTDKQTEKQ